MLLEIRKRGVYTFCSGVIHITLSAPIIGRKEELRTFRNALRGEALRNANLVTLVGDAGIGKTRIMAECARLAEGAGCRVVWSQMIEDPATPPYYGWTQLIRSCVQKLARADAPQPESDGEFADLASILPELRTDSDQAARVELADGRTAQFRLYDSVSRFLIARSREQPLVLLFDNLHLADVSSLRLLEYFVEQINGLPLLVIAAYRSGELDETHAARVQIDRLSRLAGFTELVLGGLTRDESAVLLHTWLAMVPSPQLVDQVFEQSDGNPLFVSEIGRMLSRKSAGAKSRSDSMPRFQVPATLREVIDARIGVLPEATFELLTVASVLGRDFDIAEVSGLVGQQSGELLGRLTPALNAGIIAELANRRFRFHHAMFREVLYGHLEVGRRIELHQRAADFLEARPVGDEATGLARIAHHYSEAAQPGSAKKAVAACGRAARRAFANHAFREAASFYERALQALEMSAESDAESRFHLLFELGRSQFYAAQQIDASNSLLRAAVHAYRHHWWRRFANATLEFQYVLGWVGIPHVAAVSLHEQALGHIGEEMPLRARLTASLARALFHSGQRSRAEARLWESMNIARASGDRSAQQFCLWAAQFVLISWDMADRALALAREGLALAHEADDTEAVLDFKSLALIPLEKLGAVAEMEALCAEMDAMQVASRNPHIANMVTGNRAARAILSGDWDSAIRLAREGVRQVSLQGAVGLEGRLGFQMFAICKARGELEQVAPYLERILNNSDTAKLWLPGLTLLHCELGQFSQARSALERIGSLSSLPRDDLWMLSMVYLADACRQLQDRERISEIYDSLLPVRERVVVLPLSLMLGAVSGYLAILTAALHKPRQAREHFEHAIEFNRRLDAAPELARCLVEYAAFLDGAGLEADRRQTRRLLAEASPMAESLDLKPLLARIEDLRSVSAPDHLTPRELEILTRIAAGDSNKKIAADLHLSPNTVATHVRNVLKKTGASNRTAAVRLARRAGILSAS